MDYKNLVKSARKAQQKSLSPYSKFPVGAALLTNDGKVYTGANVEVSSYGLTMCAERNTVFHAVLEGERDFKAIAVACNTDSFCPPCGACRQVLIELCGEELDVIMIDKNDNYEVKKIKDLLPYSFNNKFM